MKISEIFMSIEGEGIRAGYPAIFIRTHSCNLRCSYCDSLYAVEGDDYKCMTVSDILLELDKYMGFDRVTFTGGEPLIQPDSIELVAELLKRGFKVNVETNGAVDLYPLLSNAIVEKYRDRLIITMDWKSISSKMLDRMITDNLSLLLPQDVLKFVVGSVEDLDQMKSLVSVHDLNCNIFVSPIFGEIEPADIVKYLIRNNINNIRCQLQIHKIIYPPQMRGV